MNCNGEGTALLILIFRFSSSQPPHPSSIHTSYVAINFSEFPLSSISAIHPSHSFNPSMPAIHPTRLFQPTIPDIPYPATHPSNLFPRRRSPLRPFLPPSLPKKINNIDYNPEISDNG
jgi:hypothetical protein